MHVSMHLRLYAFSCTGGSIYCPWPGTACGPVACMPAGAQPGRARERGSRARLQLWDVLSLPRPQRKTKMCSNNLQDLAQIGGPRRPQARTGLAQARCSRRSAKLA